MIVVADTSVVLNLARAGHDGLLRALFQEVWIPPEVLREFRRQASENPRFRGLQPPSWLQVRAPATIPDTIHANSLLDEGEQAALALALQLHADAILIDEENGRAAAEQLGLNRIGILGVLLRAKVHGLIPSVAPILTRLAQDAGFWMSDVLRREVLALAGENS